jgi:hypothetical protein
MVATLVAGSNSQVAVFTLRSVLGDPLNAYRVTLTKVAGTAAAFTTPTEPTNAINARALFTRLPLLLCV